MSFSSASIPAAEAAARAAGKAQLMGSHAGELPSNFPLWTTGGLATDADASAVGYEGWRAIDRSAIERTRPNAAGASWYFVFEIPSGKVFDTLVGLNTFWPLPPTLTLQIANDTAFASALSTILSGYTPSGGRFGVALGSRYTSTGGWARLRIQFGGSTVPELGELWLGQARVLQANPQTPHDEHGKTTERRTSGAQTAHPIDVATYAGRMHLRAQLRAHTAEALDDAATYRAWKLECGAGARPGLYLRDPLGAPNGWGLMALDSGVTVPQVSPGGLAEASISGVELPPYLSAEGFD